MFSKEKLIHFYIFRFSKQLILQNRNYEVKKSKMENLINDALDPSSSDSESDEPDNESDNEPDDDESNDRFVEKIRVNFNNSKRLIVYVIMHY